MAEITPGRAALGYGTAMCPPGDTSCAQAVAKTFEQDIERRFGVFNSAIKPAKPLETYEVSSPNGERIGELRYIDGISSLCFDHSTGAKCAVVGDGAESVTTALATLQLLGLSYRQM